MSFQRPSLMSVLVLYHHSVPVSRLPPSLPRTTVSGTTHLLRSVHRRKPLLSSIYKESPEISTVREPIRGT